MVLSAAARGGTSVVGELVAAVRSNSDKQLRHHRSIRCDVSDVHAAAHDSLWMRAGVLKLVPRRHGDANDSFLFTDAGASLGARRRKISGGPSHHMRSLWRK